VKYTNSGAVALRVAQCGPDGADIQPGGQKNPPGEILQQATRCWIRFEIEDTGPGIRAEDRKRIFEPFVQLADRPATERGTGLGLAIARQNTELLGGQLAAWRPHLILMDIGMPVMGGLEATRRMRSTPAGKDVKIASATAHALADERREILAAGCDAFLRKPLTEAEVLATLSRLLGTTYIYRARDSAPAEVPPLTATDLSRLEPELANRLRSAAEQLDAKLCTQTISELEQDAPDLASRLRALVQKAQFPELLAALDEAVEGRAS
jgi:CheY-like chemotaxis protein